MVATSIHVRLDDVTATQLRELVELHEREAIGKVTASDVVRALIHEEYKRLFGPKTKARAKVAA
jgi:hypothetical protein